MNTGAAGNSRDFAASFGLSFNGSGQGGLVTGLGGGGGTPAQAGHNGSVTKVSADRVATIIAGRPAFGSVTDSNAVYAIVDLDTEVLGADVYGNDGVVVVRAAGLSPLPVVPLNLILA